jgi:hypothetical protein
VAASAGAITVFGFGVLGVMGAAKGAAMLLGALPRAVHSARAALTAARQVTRWRRSAPRPVHRTRRRRALGSKLVAPLPPLTRASDLHCALAE